MKAPLLLTVLLMGALHAEEPAPAEPAAPEPSKEEEHKTGSVKLSTRQDELSADVQQLAIEQTVQKVIDLLKECEDIMGEATERLGNHDTGGETIAAQTEVIEKIYEAAKERQKQQGGGEAGGAMMDMMKNMMGEGKSQGEGPGKKDGEASDKGGAGKTGLSDSANTVAGAAGEGREQEPRKVPKAAGVAGKALPEEFRGALDAYNRGAEKLSK